MGLYEMLEFILSEFLHIFSPMHILTFGLLFLIWECRKFWYARKRLRELSSQLNGPTCIPIFGNALMIFKNRKRLFSTITSLIDCYGSTFRLWMGPKLYVIISDPQDIGTILSNAEILSRDSYINRTARRLMGLGLITTSGEYWKYHRKMITPAFHYDALQEFVADFVHHADSLNNALGQVADGSTFDIFPYIATSVFNSVCDTIMGTCSSNRFSNQEYTQHLEKAVTLSHEMFSKPWLMVKWIHEFTQLNKDIETTLSVLHGFTDDLIKARMDRSRKTSVSSMGEEAKRRHVLLDNLIAAMEASTGQKFTPKELRDEMNTMLVAGNETTATSVCFVLLLLGMYPRVQEKLTTELLSVFGDDPDRPATAADLRRMHYLDAIIKESLRLFPPAPIIHREIETNEVKIGGCTLPVGTSVVIVNYVSQRHPDHFDNPNHFCPERFLEGSDKTRHPYAYIPFGAGSRICVGRTYAHILIKTFVATIMRQFRIESRLGWQDLSKVGPGIVLKLESGYPVEMLPRNEEKVVYRERFRRASYNW